MVSNHWNLLTWKIKVHIFFLNSRVQILTCIIFIPRTNSRFLIQQRITGTTEASKRILPGIEETKKKKPSWFDNRPVPIHFNLPPSLSSYLFSICIFAYRQILPIPFVFCHNSISIFFFPKKAQTSTCPFQNHC